MKMMLKLMSYEWKTQRWWFYSGAVLMAMLYFVMFDGFNAFKIPNDAMIRMKHSEVDFIKALTRIGSLDSFLLFPLFGVFVALMQMGHQKKADKNAFWRHRACTSLELYGAKLLLGLGYTLFVLVGYTLGKLYWVDFHAARALEIPLFEFGVLVFPVFLGGFGYLLGALVCLPSFSLVERILLMTGAWALFGNLSLWMFESFFMTTIIDMRFKEASGIDMLVYTGILLCFPFLFCRFAFRNRKTGLALALYPVALFATLIIASFLWSFIGPGKKMTEFDPLFNVNPKITAFTRDGFPSFWKENLESGMHIGRNAITGELVEPDQQSGKPQFLRRYSARFFQALDEPGFTVKPLYVSTLKQGMRWFFVKTRGLFYLSGEENQTSGTYFGLNGLHRNPAELDAFEDLVESHPLQGAKTLLIAEHETLYANFETGEVVSLADWQPEGLGYIEGNIVIYNNERIKVFRVEQGELLSYPTPAPLKGAGILRIDATPVGIGVSLPMHPINKTMENYGKHSYSALLGWDGQIRNETSFPVEMKLSPSRRSNFWRWTPFIALLPQFDCFSLDRLEPFKNLRVTWPMMIPPQVYENEMNRVYLLIALKHVFYIWLYLGSRVPLRRLKPSQRWYRGFGILVLGFPFLISLWVVDKLEGLVSCPHCKEKRPRYGQECPYCKNDWPKAKLAGFELRKGVQLNSQEGGSSCG